jgi:kynurenine formamidase
MAFGRAEQGVRVQFIDLSAVISGTPADAPPFERCEITYADHAAGASQVETLFQVPRQLLRDGEGWATETLALMTHNTTHIDAPWHYNSRTEGRPAATIDELPLEWFFSDGVVVDMTGKADGEAVGVEDLRAALARMDYALKPLDILLVRTGRDAHYGDADYVRRGCGVSAAATAWLYERGVRVMGIDAWSWDSPLHLQAAAALARQETGVFWAAHQVDLAYAQIERLVNLSALPASGFQVACFPLKIQRGSAAPARVVAILP